MSFFWVLLDYFSLDYKIYLYILKTYKLHKGISTFCALSFNFIWGYLENKYLILKNQQIDIFPYGWFLAFI